MPVVVLRQYSSLFSCMYKNCTYVREHFMSKETSNQSAHFNSCIYTFFYQLFVKEVFLKGHANLRQKQAHSIRKGKLEGSQGFSKIGNRRLENYFDLKPSHLKTIQKAFRLFKHNISSFFPFLGPISTYLIENWIRIRLPSLIRIKSGSETLAEMRREFLPCVRPKVKINTTDWVSP